VDTFDGPVGVAAKRHPGEGHWGEAGPAAERAGKKVLDVYRRGGVQELSGKKADGDAVAWCAEYWKRPGRGGKLGHKQNRGEKRNSMT